MSRDGYGINFPHFWREATIEAMRKANDLYPPRDPDWHHAFHRIRSERFEQYVQPRPSTPTNPYGE